MSDPRKVKKEEDIETEIKDLHLDHARNHLGQERLPSRGLKQADSNGSRSPPANVKSRSSSDESGETEDLGIPYEPQGHEAVLRGEVTLKREPGQPPKLSRSTSHKVIAGPAQLYNDYPDKTKEAQATFTVLEECLYSSKYIGSTEHDSMECDCSEEWGEDSIILLFIACRRY